ncbi:MAG: stage II sporulation protein P [Firmicutes bacterium]|nr:stage II sporulation protein P [Bacillota bacterium]
MKRKIFIVFLLAFVITLSVSLAGIKLPVTSRSPLLDFFDNLDISEISREDLLAQRYYTMVYENGKEIMVTGRKIHVGDEYLNANNKLYRVFSVQDYVARARFIREVGAVFSEEPVNFMTVLRQRIFGEVQPVQTEQDNNEDNEDEEEDEDEEDLEPQAQPKRIIGVYHTHNAESYVPTDGTDSINGEGGIHDVGEAFTKALEDKDINVLHSTTLHLPHDRGAYRRSRVTAEKLLEKGPDVIFDVHRDAGPASSYATQIDDEWVTQVHLVVGRQNPNMQTTRQFALDLKNTADDIHPTLVKGIFMARGNYNQDITPTSMLIEVGTHLNSREAAQDGVALFADVVSTYFYGPEDENGEQASPAPNLGPANNGGGGSGNAGGNVTRAAARNAFWMLAVTAVIAVGFFFINTPIATIRAQLTPWFAQTVPYTEKSDLFLEALQEKIRAAALIAAEKTVAFIQAGDGALAPIALKINQIYFIIVDKIGELLNSGDQVTGYWQERIRDFALTVKEKGQQLRNRDKLK